MHWWSALGAAALARPRARPPPSRRSQPGATAADATAPRRPTRSAAAPCSTRPTTRTPRASTSPRAPATGRPSRTTATIAALAPFCELARDAGALSGERDPKLQEGGQAGRGTARSEGTTRSCSAGSSRPPNTWPDRAAGPAAQGRRGRGRHRTLAPAEREERVAAAGSARTRVLVATDCLSEGINLQEHFDAVVHYDLVLEPDPPRTARGPRRPLRPARADRPGASPTTGRTTRSTGSCSTCCSASTSGSASRSASPSRSRPTRPR